MTRAAERSDNTAYIFVLSYSLNDVVFRSSAGVRVVVYVWWKRVNNRRLE